MGGRGRTLKREPPPPEPAKKAEAKKEPKGSSAGAVITDAEMNTIKSNAEYGQYMDSSYAHLVHGEAAKQGLTANESNLVYAYTRDLAYQLNANLRDGAKDEATKMIRNKLNTAIHNNITYLPTFTEGIRERARIKNNSNND